ncbi:hypothetical protein SEA_HOTOROBO_106 [Gordonia phage Hotorobo]|uniref:Uncharacterized protein n=1 Tax=Gordonia phage Hotorobo TaxID=1821554 RepID=A0A142K8G5_9CAUD|nr:hypothetical protein BJD64_gp027 [Gordonia phage Hotorobo]AMS02398.1 hypothetical protein SEA_HOTOROBO_106 [Gordonia phage Hotorobo]
MYHRHTWHHATCDRGSHPARPNQHRKGSTMGKTIKRNATRTNNQLHRGRRLRASELRELDRMQATGVQPIVGWVRSSAERGNA